MRKGPRLSIDLDLVFPDHTVPLERALEQIAAALHRSATRLQFQGFQTHTVPAIDASESFKNTVTGPQLVILGRNILLVTHGFNVNRDKGYLCISNWINLLVNGVNVPPPVAAPYDLPQKLDDSWVCVGVLWPGDSSWLGPLCYPGEGEHAIACGNLLAQFIKDNFAGSNSISFVSHSLGARFLLQTAATLSKVGSALKIRQVAITAGAINDDCLTNEY